MNWKFTSPGSCRTIGSGLERFRLQLLGALAIAAAVLITYFPALGIGFYTDDYLALDAAGRITGLDYVIKFFDPRVQRFWYRPMVGMQWKVEYLMFGGEAVWYHLVQVLFHLLNCLLLYVLVTRITRQWRVGFVTGLVYATLSLASMTVYWTPVHDPLAGVFALLALLFWLDHLESGSRLKGALAGATLVAAFLSKEITVGLPILLLLADRLLIGKPVTWRALVGRYFPLVVISLVFGVLQWIVMTQSVFTQQIGYGVGPHLVATFVQDLAWLGFPWESEEWLRYAWLGGLVLVFLYVSLRRDRRLVFLGAAALLPMLVIVPIPPHLFNPRYLYLPLMASAAGLALLLEALRRRVPRLPLSVTGALLGLVVTGVAVNGSLGIGERVENYGGFIRQVRQQFRPVYQRHAAFAPDSYLYFVDTPLQAQDISGLMFLRYGANVTVSGVDQFQPVEIRKHQAAYVFYLDDQNVFQEQAVLPNAAVQVTPLLPVQFQDSIVLDWLDVANPRVKPGEPVILLFGWRAIAPISKDYTVFVHLVDSREQTVAGMDSPPRKGLVPTSTWRVKRVQPDGMVLPLEASVPPGQYTLEVGLYDPLTMQRLTVRDDGERAAGDKIVVGTIEIVR